MICEQEIGIFTDHKNLLFTFYPHSVETSIACHKIMKVARCALELSTFNYVIEHVDGDTNDSPGTLTRWMKDYRSSKSFLRLVRKSFAYYDILSSQYNTDFIWPDRDSIMDAETQVENPSNCTKAEGGFVPKIGKIWIPDNAHKLKLRLLSVAHAGKIGHRGCDSTIDTLILESTWTRLAEEAREFTNDCLLFTIAK